MPTMRMLIWGTAFSTSSLETPGAASSLKRLLIHRLMGVYVTRLSIAMNMAPEMWITPFTAHQCGYIQQDINKRHCWHQSRSHRLHKIWVSGPNPWVLENKRTYEGNLLKRLRYARIKGPAG